MTKITSTKLVVDKNRIQPILDFGSISCLIDASPDHSFCHTCNKWDTPIEVKGVEGSLMRCPNCNKVLFDQTRR